MLKRELKDKSLAKAAWVRRGGHMRTSATVREHCRNWGEILSHEPKDHNDCVMRVKIGEIPQEHSLQHRKKLLDSGISLEERT